MFGTDPQTEIAIGQALFWGGTAGVACCLLIGLFRWK